MPGNEGCRVREVPVVTPDREGSTEMGTGRVRTSDWTPSERLQGSKSTPEEFHGRVPLYVKVRVQRRY